MTPLAIARILPNVELACLQKSPKRVAAGLGLKRVLRSGWVWRRAAGLISPPLFLNFPLTERDLGGIVYLVIPCQNGKAQPLLTFLFLDHAFGA